MLIGQHLFYFVCAFRKVMSSRQMKEVEIALEVDAAATSELNLEVRDEMTAGWRGDC